MSVLAMYMVQTLAMEICTDKFDRVFRDSILSASIFLFLLPYDYFHIHTLCGHHMCVVLFKGFTIKRKA